MSTDDLQGWDIADAATVLWVPWGSSGDARAKVLATADGFTIAEVEARVGYDGMPHVHASPEMLYVLEGELRNQGRVMRAGDAYAARAGSKHTDFHALSPARYLSIFRL